MNAWSDAELRSMLAATGLRMERFPDAAEDWVLASAG